MSQLEIAQEIAHDAHFGQRYRDGRDFIEAHVRPVATMIANMGYSQDYQAVGWLHDVLEYSKANGREITEWDLHDRGVAPHILHATVLLTKTVDVPHGLYIAKIAHDKYATVGKFADSSNNFANTILQESGMYTEKFYTYLGNIAFLKPLLPEPDMSMLNVAKSPRPLR